MIAEPPEDMNNKENVPILAASVHKLSNKYGLTPPNWIFDKRCYLPDTEPHYGYNATRPDFRTWLEENSPIEYKQRNLFVGDAVLMRT